MNAFARLILSAGVVAGMAVPAMAQTTAHGAKPRSHVTHHSAKASPVAATAPVTAAAPAPMAVAKPAVPAKN